MSVRLATGGQRELAMRYDTDLGIWFRPIDESFANYVYCRSCYKHHTCVKVLSLLTLLG